MAALVGKQLQVRSHAGFGSVVDHLVNQVLVSLEPLVRPQRLEVVGLSVLVAG